MSGAKGPLSAGAAVLAGFFALAKGCAHDGAALRTAEHIGETRGARTGAAGAADAGQAGQDFKSAFRSNGGDASSAADGLHAPTSNGWLESTVDNSSDQKWQSLLSRAKDNPDSTGFFARNGIGAQMFAHLQGSVFEREALTLTAIPQQAGQFNNVFGVLPNSRELQEMNAAARAFNALGTPVGDVADAKDFRVALASNTHNVVVVVGHNVNGRLMLGSGKSLNLDDMARQCAEAYKLCVFLSCSSDRYVAGNAIGAPMTLTFAEARKMASEINELLAVAERSLDSYQTVAEAIPLLVNDQQSTSHVRLALTYIAPPVGLGALTVTATDRHNG